MAQRRRTGPKQKHNDRTIKRWTLWLSLGAAIAKLLQVAISFFHDNR
jgi:hypothetical protein